MGESKIPPGILEKEHCFKCLWVLRISPCNEPPTSSWDHFGRGKKNKTPGIFPLGCSLFSSPLEMGLSEIPVGFFFSFCFGICFFVFL